MVVGYHTQPVPENRLDIKIDYLGVRYCIMDDCGRVSDDDSEFCSQCLTGLADPPGGEG